jgi:hypothetical protein
LQCDLKLVFWGYYSVMEKWFTALCVATSDRRANSTGLYIYLIPRGQRFGSQQRKIQSDTFIASEMDTILRGLATASAAYRNRASRGIC